MVDLTRETQTDANGVVSPELLRASEVDALDSLFLDTFNEEVDEVPIAKITLERLTRDRARYPDGKAPYLTLRLTGLDQHTMDRVSRNAAEWAEAVGTVKGKVRTGTDNTKYAVELILHGTLPGYEKNLWFDATLMAQKNVRDPRSHVYARLNPGEIQRVSMMILTLSGFDSSLEQAARD